MNFCLFEVLDGEVKFELRFWDSLLDGLLFEMIVLVNFFVDEEEEDNWLLLLVDDNEVKFFFS